MNRHILSILLLCVIVSACNLDIPLENEIGGYDAINTVQRAQDALNGAFDIYPKNSSLSFALLSEDFTPTHLINESAQGEDKLYRWEPQEISSLAESLWQSYYSVIAQANNLLASEQYISINNDKEMETWKFVKGNALGIKAMAYYELLSLFTAPYKPENPGIVLKEKVKYEKKNRSDAHECVKEIEQLLKDSYTLLNEVSNNFQSYYYFNTRAITLLQSRVAIYAQKYDVAAGYAEKLISEAGYKDRAPNTKEYESLWHFTKTEKSEERIFLFDNYDYIFKQFDINERGDIVAVSPTFDYSTDDLRYNRASFPTTILDYQGKSLSVCLLAKYRQELLKRTSMPIHWLRLAEAYFILAECYMQQGEETKSRDMVNIVLQKRNASLIPEGITGDNLLERIRFEKQKEFVGEGINLFDLKRWGKDIRRYATNSTKTVNVIRKDDYRLIFPLPYAELTQNEGIEQNPGWPKVIR